MKEIGKYQIIKKIGTGGMATVYLVRDKLMDKHFAMKILHNQYLENKKIRDRFIREAKVQINLSHPNIIRCYDVNFQSGYYFILLEYVKGKSLAEVLKAHPGHISLESNLAIFIQILAAIGYAHRQGIVHRDIKPHNILVQNYSGKLSGHDVFKVGDFGIAKALALGADSHTRTGARLGTLQYMSPEQIKDSAAVDFRSDIYSMGVTFFQLITGSLPYHDTTNELSIMEAIVKQPIVLPDKYRRLYPRWVEKLIKKATEKDAKKRFQSCDEFMAAIQAGLNGTMAKNISERLEVAPTKFAEPQKPIPVIRTEAMQNTSPNSNHAKSKKKSRGTVLAIIFAVILILAATFFGVRYFNQLQIMPNLVGLQVGSAKQALLEKDITPIHFKKQASKTARIGTVLSTSPAAGSQALPGTEVELTFAYQAGHSNRFKNYFSVAAQKMIDSRRAFPYDLIFADIFNGKQKSWTPLGGITSEDIVKYVDGQLLMEKKSADGAAMLLAYPGPMLQNFIIRVDFVNSTRSTDQSAGIGLMAGKNIVAFLINPPLQKVFCGFLHLDTWDGKWKETFAIHSKTRNSLEIVCFNGQINMYLNGEFQRWLKWKKDATFRPVLMNNMLGKPAKFDNVVIVGLL